MVQADVSVFQVQLVCHSRADMTEYIPRTAVQSLLGLKHRV